ncbi:hypothetical protein COLU111180_13235 [Cohnella lubricantis]|uniref:Uncharacterized protein n=1 Tax=Cohnella lubricantis TaxID=2163172 RepID=A0A841T4U7_9BACL|nr:hypothetical protein [Cohnella lubricantis]MBB6676573.1 hypothetical protein [Cohnella lubricantis]MBP2117416.1 hypothetical protein [Cohnella lubricantis]
MNSADERKRMIGQMAKDAGILEDPQWLERLDEPVPLWVVLDMMLRWIDRTEREAGPFD